jgi:hypothetical protein
LDEYSKEMFKDFDEWNEEKKNFEKYSPESLIFHEREIWWCSLGVNLGDEQDGKNNLFERPVLVVRKTSQLRLVSIKRFLIGKAELTL